jgi:hypothetical protein
MPNLKEGDFAMTAHGGDEEFHIGQVVHVMREGMLGIPGGEYTLEATAENPAVLIQLFEQDERWTMGSNKNIFCLHDEFIYSY